MKYRFPLGVLLSALLNTLPLQSLSASPLNSSPLNFSPLRNADFEQGLEHWQIVNPDVNSLKLSKKAHQGKNALSLSKKGAYAAQLIEVKPNTNYRFSAYIKGTGNIGIKAGDKLYYESQKKTKKWQYISLEFNSLNTNKVAAFVSFNHKKGLFDTLSLEELDNNIQVQANSIIPKSAGGFGLSPDLPPGRNFELIDWYLNTPDDADGDQRSDRFDEIKLVKGFEDSRYFYTADDGGMVFRATVKGAKTSKNTKYTRTELREMLRRGDGSIRVKGKDGVANKNNWVFSSAPRTAQRNAGGIDGVLKATLAVNHVTTTGKKGQIGRVIVGQIHARKDEPIRLYYRKLPNNTRGSIYAAHEISRGDDIYYEILGNRKNNTHDPEDGIALNEKFSYEINAQGNTLKVTISQNGKTLGTANIDMSNSGYDVNDDFMYFKAGVYNQNNSGDPEDYVQATFYELENSHKGYKF